MAGLAVLRCGPPHWLSLRVYVGPFWCGGAVSSFSPAVCWVGFWWASCWGWLLCLPATPAVFRGVSCRRLPLGGYATFLAPIPVLLLQWSSVCWVGGVLGVALGFPPCTMLFLRFCAAYPTAGSLRGFCLSELVCLTYCCANGVGWAATLTLCSQCFSYTGWLAGVHWVLHPMTGNSHGGCGCSWCGSMVVPYGSPCL